MVDSGFVPDDPLVPLHLLVWATETVLTTATCTIQVLSWEGLGAAEKKDLKGLYLPYLLLGKRSRSLIGGLFGFEIGWLIKRAV